MTIQFKKFLLILASVGLGVATFILLILLAWLTFSKRGDAWGLGIAIVVLGPSLFIVSIGSIFIFYILFKKVVLGTTKTRQDSTPPSNKIPYINNIISRTIGWLLAVTQIAGLPLIFSYLAYDTSFEFMFISMSVPTGFLGFFFFPFILTRPISRLKRFLFAALYFFLPLIIAILFVSLPLAQTWVVNTSEYKTAQEIINSARFLPTGDTTNWKTYRNEKYGFELKYPSNFIIEKGYSDKDLATADSILIQDVPFAHLSSPAGLDLHGYLRFKPGTTKDKILPDYNYSISVKHISLSPLQTEEINGINFYSFISSEGYYFADGSGGMTRSTKSKFNYFDTAGGSFELIFPDQPVYNQILSTFKFIN